MVNYILPFPQWIQDGKNLYCHHDLFIQFIRPSLFNWLLVPCEQPWNLTVLVSDSSYHMKCCSVLPLLFSACWPKTFVDWTWSADLGFTVLENINFCYGSEDFVYYICHSTIFCKNVSYFITSLRLASLEVFFNLIFEQEGGEEGCLLLTVVLLPQQLS